MTLRYSTDIVIFGGGIAGLWLLNRLRQLGHRAILLEARTLGGGQTIASQGIIHGGLKYALSGSLTGAAQAIAEMPARWRQCLEGNGELDLSRVNVLSDHYYMWSESGYRSKLKTFLGSKSLRGRVEAVKPSEYPEFFATATVSGSLYKLPDFVVDTDSLIAELGSRQEDHIFKIEPESLEFQDAGADHDSNTPKLIKIRTGKSEIAIDSKQLVFCSGEGNSRLIEQCGLNSIKSQVRPLNMVYLKSRNLPPVYVHCIGNDFNLTPRLTVTSHQDFEGNTVWYLGGEIAESGVGKSSEEQILAASELLAKLFPWIEIEPADWHSFNINRAEADINNNYRPDDAYFAVEGGVVVAWPTKLTLAPSLADKLVNQFKNLEKRETEIATEELRKHLPLPELAPARWS